MTSFLGFVLAQGALLFASLRVGALPRQIHAFKSSRRSLAASIYCVVIGGAMLSIVVSTQSFSATIFGIGVFTIVPAAILAMYFLVHALQNVSKSLKNKPASYRLGAAAAIAVPLMPVPCFPLLNAIVRLPSPIYRGLFICGILAATASYLWLMMALGGARYRHASFSASAKYGTR